ncbi:FAD-binding, type 2 [Penicillium griseofulvum]|uniref:FAD-binding, type 2 n=1 Tax=Penicillium patulum TaxID=5078 RepID=A0A135M008_PENPA|nr:FAD-binding, type 2 [Penicillium griseofulvum]KXG54556.1 FAD-binding, type 2 [Penicillium griseofulvum]
MPESCPLDALLQGSNEINIADEISRRDLMKALKAKYPEKYRDVLETYDPNQQHLLTRFVAGQALEDLAREIPLNLPTSVGYSQTIGKPLSATPVKYGAEHGDEYESVDLGLYNDADKKNPVLAYLHVVFSNWGNTVTNTPLYTCIPDTVYGVRQIVSYAKANGYGVRVSGYRHSWSSIFGPDKSQDRQFILISTLQLDRAILGKDKNEEASGKYADYKVELNEIKEPDSTDSGIQADQHLVSVGCATTNEDLRRWCLQTSDYKWTLPLNVIMVEITFGGSNAPICHGAGYKTKTLSDLVYEIEYVDANAKVQTINRKDGNGTLIQAASGCFGLLGVVTRLTLVLDKMTVALMKPEKVPVVQAIPPPTDMVDKLPDELKKSYDGYTPEEIDKFVREFERRAFNDYYAEWFWFPFHKQVWINTWDLDTTRAKPSDYPSKDEIGKQITQSFILEMLQETLRKERKVEPVDATKLISDQAMETLPPNEDTSTILTWLPNALHFRRGIQNCRVRDLEVEIPIPTKENLEIVRKAWWQAILVTYETKATCPMRMPLEMRITADSDVLMAPQRGNIHGTCAIEVLTPRFMESEWKGFAQLVLDQWMTLRKWNGQNLNIRPHWAKEWQQYKVDGKPWPQYLKETSFKKEIDLFKTALTTIGENQGWTLQNIQDMFSNEVFDNLIFQ